MTEQLYLKDSYMKDFEASVTKIDAGGKLVFLDKTAFFPKSGGQLDDSGYLIYDNKRYNILMIKKLGSEIMHEVDNLGLQVGDKVQGYLDWEKRYKMMRLHTASHILSQVVHKETGALITGNQLDLDKSRIDFDLENFDREKLAEYCNKANEIIKQNLEVTTEILPREKAMEIPSVVKLAGALPPSIPELRIVKIGDFDIQADGGTHVKNTSEIGEVEITGAENKGKNNRRLYFRLK